MIVLDSSAMLAYFKNEQGGELVAALFMDEEFEVGVVAHAINLCEACYDLRRTFSESKVDSMIQILFDAGIRERNDMDSEFWRDVAFLIYTQRSAGHSLALGDACGLALARRVGGEFYTSDRTELQHIKAEMCPVTFIR